MFKNLGDEKNYGMKLTIGVLLFTCLTLTSCMNDAGRGSSRLIEDFTVGGTGEENKPSASICSDFYDPAEDLCVSSGCPVGTHEANEQEEDQILTQFEQTKNQLDSNEAERIEQSLEESVICAPGSGILRPDKQVFIEKDYCGCKDGQPITIGPCSSTCQSKGDTGGKEILFVNVDLGEEITLNSSLQDLNGWCNNEIPESDLRAPACEVILENESGELPPKSPQSLASQSFSVDISDINFDQTFKVKICETQSGSDVCSEPFQIFKTDPSNDNTPQGPLKIMPISQYSCIQRSGFQGNDGNFFENIIRFHFYFASNSEPLPLPPGDTFLFCHDPQQFGIDDSALYPRLELIPQHMSLWDVSDVRMFDQNGNDQPDINDQIRERLLDDFGVQKDPSFQVFQFFPALTSPESTQTNIGFIMVPFLDDQGRGFCPGQEEYNSNDPLFKIFKDIVGVSTEGLYIAIKEPEIIRDDDGNIIDTPDDYIYIRENLLKDIWFYVENGNLLEPNDNNSGQKTIHFYWPPDPNNPFTKKDNQRLYTIRSPNNLDGSGAGLDLQTGITPSDKRLGCIPAID
mgnify:CR=1 FL=1